MRRVLSTLGSLAFCVMLGLGLFVALSGVWDNRPIAAELSIVLTALMIATPPLRSDLDTCAGCRHRRDEHHGICQACHRDVVGRVAGAPTFACERFSTQQRRPSLPFGADASGSE